MVLRETSNLAVLLRDELLIHRRDLDEHVLGGQIEIRPEELRRILELVEFDRKVARLVLPFDVIEVEEQRKLALALVRKLDGISRLRVEVVCVRQLAWASTAPVSPATESGKSRWISPTSSACTGPTAIPKTP